MLCTASAFALLAASVRAFPAIQEPNSGPVPNVGFDPRDQYVKVGPGSGHEFIAPSSRQQRGPCPGLNAAANHGFIPRDGILDIHETVHGLEAAYAFGRDYSTLLGYIAILVAGSIIDGKWAIGGPIKPSTSRPNQGLSSTHNKFEGDSSASRGDAYLHNGDAVSLNIPSFTNLYNDGKKQGKFTFSTIRRQAIRTHNFTVENNPYGFYGPAFFVPPMFHQYIPAMMSNHSETEIQGILTLQVLRSFFAVNETKTGLKWLPGQERIPQNWYRRPTKNPYGLDASFLDLKTTMTQSPQIADIGGNLGKPNSFKRILVEDLTDGAYTSATLLDGNNLLCFSLQGLVFSIPGAARKVSTVPELHPFSVAYNQTLEKYGCQRLKKYNVTLFSQFPGYTKSMSPSPPIRH